ncbi:hypothetical protein ZOSMA_42G00320 [Zostera marina]|uniref:Uncharacterized protein n=1 Tax=Zostera marina TaxID=29655 RepID=A0A0K9P1Q0_ZOSMR|nr:hypothetical protein ZOSMA_42G00320 [Zostera marina]
MDQSLSTETTLAASITRPHRQSPRRRVVVRSSRQGGFGGGEGGGDVVNESMIVLRKRIQQMRIKEKIQDPVPVEWTEMEKNYVEEGYYNSDVFRGIPLLQIFLLNSRPFFVFGLLILLLLSLFTSFISVCSFCFQLCKFIFFR